MSGCTWFMILIVLPICLLVLLGPGKKKKKCEWSDEV